MTQPDHTPAQPAMTTDSAKMPALFWKTTRGEWEKITSRDVLACVDENVKLREREVKWRRLVELETIKADRWRLGYADEVTKLRKELGL